MNNNEELTKGELQSVKVMSTSPGWRVIKKEMSERIKEIEKSILEEYLTQEKYIELKNRRASIVYLLSLPEQLIIDYGIEEQIED